MDPTSSQQQSVESSRLMFLIHFQEAYQQCLRAVVVRRTSHLVAVLPDGSQCESAWTLEFCRAGLLQSRTGRSAACHQPRAQPARCRSVPRAIGHVPVCRAVIRNLTSLADERDDFPEYVYTRGSLRRRCLVSQSWAALVVRSSGDTYPDCFAPLVRLYVGTAMPTKNSR